MLLKIAFNAMILAVKKMQYINRYVGIRNTTSYFQTIQHVKPLDMKCLLTLHWKSLSSLSMCCWSPSKYSGYMTIHVGQPLSLYIIAVIFFESCDHLSTNVDLIRVFCLMQSEQFCISEYCVYYMNHCYHDPQYNYISSH